MNGVKYVHVMSNDEASSNTARTREKNNDRPSGSNIFLYASACAVYFPTFACGLSMGWTSPVLPKLDGSVEPENNPLSTPITYHEATWIGSLLSVGAIFGPFVSGIFINEAGRKIMMLASMVPFVVAFITAAYAHNVYLFYVVRFLFGISVGIVFSLTPTYIAEISEKSVRGSLGALFGTFACLGILTSYALGPYLSLTVYNGLCSLVCILFVPLFWFYVPETPHFLIMVNEEETARRVLMKFRSKTDIQKEFDEIKDTVNEHASGNLSLRDILQNRGLKRALILTLGLVNFQQLSGINVILFYSQTIFAETGSSIPPHICAITIGAIQVVATVLTPFFAEKAGKRFLLLLSAAGMLISMTFLGTYFYLQEKQQNVSSLFWIPVLSLAIFVFMFNVGFASFPFAVMGEMFPSKATPVAATVATSACSLLGFVLIKFFHHVAGLIGMAASFWIFTGSNALAFLFVYVLLPDTSGRSLREVQEILSWN